jgi:hypothetical protein
MNKAQAVYVVYCLADSLDNPAMLATLQSQYGEFGILEAVKGIRALCDQWDIPLPESVSER